MIISRTPFRVSFFGGGTDYPAWFEENGGSVLATTINKYCYITCRYLPPFFEHKYRIVYSQVETVNKTEEIQHPVVRVALKMAGIEEGLEAVNGRESGVAFRPGFFFCSWGDLGRCDDGGAQGVGRFGIFVIEEQWGEFVP